MFSFMRKVKESYERQQAEQRAVLTEDLTTILVNATYRGAITNDLNEDHPDTPALMEKQGKIVIGFEMFNAGKHPREIPDHEPIIKAATALAYDANNQLTLRKYDKSQATQRILFLLGFSE
ncbi:hypothetical protein AEAC466_19195 [Asticcacaulis sp. AC466]|uniref:hypothetical protein n=1 Tax=Asticcacaulis sp. AC466 TaxID=1282362 RepID=UPI0003C3D967|nr:hypothetical protein [Asticcacaulis sp. AC466]ESQ82046.1 hypothetical protein AEAC466_19195 [Asticcacaulis sp. AC466]